MLDVVFKLGAEVFGEAADREHGGICQCANGAAGHVVAHAVEQFQIVGTAFATGDAVHDTVEPARTFAAGRALAAGFFVVEIAQPLQGFDHAHVFVHHDNRARTEHGPGFGNAVIVHVQAHHNVAGQHGRGRTAGNNGFEFFAAAHTASHFQQFGKRRTQWHFVIAGAFHVAGNGEELGTACTFNALVGKGFAAVADNEGDGRQGFGIVDGGGFAV